MPLPKCHLCVAGKVYVYAKRSAQLKYVITCNVSSGPYTFSIGDTSGLSPYVRGGICTQVKMSETLQFVSYNYCATVTCEDIL